MRRSFKLYILIAKFFTVIILNLILLNCVSDESIKTKGKLDISFASADSSLISCVIKFAEIKEQEILKKNLNRLTSTDGQFGKDSVIFWNGSRNEYQLYGDEKANPYLRRLRLGKETMRAIYFPPNASLSYRLEVPEKSKLQFTLASPSVIMKKLPNNLFCVDVSSNSDKSKTYKYDLLNYKDLDTGCRTKL
jgi:hypothetical protein